MPERTPPGWYPDPLDAGQERWWDGQAWQDHTRPRDTDKKLPGIDRHAPAAAPSAAQARARRARRGPVALALSLGGIVLLGLGALVFVLDRQRDAAEPSAEDPAGDSVAATQPEESDEADESPGAEENGPAPPTGGNETDEEPSVVKIDFDGVCTVEVGAGDIDDPDTVRPWQFAACESAPVSLDGFDLRWIVVVASLNGDDFSMDEAHRRANEVGLPGQVLWSTHYPSLNPHLWVVFDGPFEDRDAASAAAERRRGGSYARELSDDEGDRYCQAADGCLGERRRD